MVARTAVRDGERQTIELKDHAAIEGMARAGALVADTLDALRARCLPGVSLQELDRLAHERITAAGAIPSFLGYPGPTPFPGSACLSVNEIVVHGLPGPQTLREGDIIAIDIGAILDGWHGDAAITVAVGAVEPAAARLIADAEGALAAAIAVARAGNRLLDVSAAVERHGRRRGYGIVREYTGHGIGREMHEPPSVPSVVVRGVGSGPTLRAGMTFTIEPIFTLGTSEVVEGEDGWTVRTADGSRAAHVEHTIAIAPRGPARILTRRA